MGTQAAGLGPRPAGSGTVRPGHFIDGGVQALEEELGRTWKGVGAAVKDTGGQGRLPGPASRLGQSSSCMDFASVAGRGTGQEQISERGQCQLQAELRP